MASSSDALDNLHTTIESLRSVILHLQTFPANPVIESNPRNALALLSTSATLLHAQITKLSLLLLNKPFTPTAITHILRVLATSILPALTTGAQLANTDQYPACVATKTRREVNRLLSEVKSMLAEIPTDERGIDKLAGQGRDPLASTGIIWERCDRLLDLGKRGVGDFLRKKVDNSKELLADAIEELEEWMGMTDSNARDLQCIVDLKWKEELGLPGGLFVELLSLFKSVVATLRLVQKIYPPLLKRRIGRFPMMDAKTKPEDFPPKELVQKLSNVAESCHFFSSEADDIAAALYQGDERTVQQRLAGLKQRARECMESMSLNWEGKTDELTDWTAKWIAKLDEA